MKKSILILAAISLFGFNANARTQPDYFASLKPYEACFILYSTDKQKIVSEYNPKNRCNQRIAPDSTFKIPLSLMAFNSGLISQNTVFKWDGKKGVIPEHEHDQTPKTWLQYSVVWVSQQLTPQLGLDRIQGYLKDFHYGNQNFSGGITQAWLSNSLKISAFEQLNFLKAMLNNQLAVSKSSVINTKKNLYLGKLDNGADYFGKTGSGHQGQLRDGWFIGFIQHHHQQYIFVSNLTDKRVNVDDHFGSQLLKPITITLLNNYFKTLSLRTYPSKKK